MTRRRWRWRERKRWGKVRVVVVFVVVITGERGEGVGPTSTTSTRLKAWRLAAADAHRVTLCHTDCVLHSILHGSCMMALMQTVR